MKKFGTIIALATLMTVGGVYATFNYAQGTASEASTSLNPTIEGVGTTTSKGKIEINSTFAIKVDDEGQLNGEANNYFTKMQTSGEFKVVFTPEVGADADVRDHGISLKMKLEITGTNTYNNQDIFTLNMTTNPVVLNNGDKILGSYTVVDLASYISLTRIELKTLAEYNAYKTQLEGVSIKVTVSENI